MSQNTTKMTAFNKKSVFLVLSITIILGLYFLLLPRIFNIKNYSQQIKTEVQKNLNFPTKIGSIDTNLTWNLGVRVDISKIDIKNKDHSDFVSTGPSSLELSLLELLQHKIKIRKIEIKNLKIAIKKLPKGRFNIENIFDKNPKIVFKNTEITAKNYQLLLQNDLITPKQSYLIKGDKLSLSDFTPKKHIEISTDGTITKDNRTVNFILITQKNNATLFIKNFEMKSPKIKAKIEGHIYGTNSEAPNLDLKLILKNTQANDIAHLFPADIKMHYDVFGNFKKLQLQSNLNANIDIKGSSKKHKLFGYLNFDKFSLSRNHKTISNGSGKVYFRGKSYTIDADILLKPKQHLYINGNITPPDNKINLGVKGNEIELGLMQELLFAIRDIIGFDLGHFVSNSRFDGNGSASFYIHGDSTRPFLDGYLRCSDCSINYSGLSRKWEHVFGKVEFKERNIYFRHIKTFMIKSHVFIDGAIIKTKINLIFSSKKLNATETRNLINESRNLRATKKLIHDMKAISGYVKATLRFGGNTKSHMDFKDFVIDVKNNSITYEEVGFPIKLVKGRIIINDKGTFFQELQVTILETSGKLTGQIIAKKSNLKPNFNVQIKNFSAKKLPYLTKSPLISPKQKQMINRFKNLDGTFDADISFLPNDYLANLNCHNTSGIYAPLNLPLKLKKGGIKFYSKEAVLESMESQVGDWEVLISGSVKDKILIKNLSVAKNNTILLNANGGIKKSKTPTFENFNLEFPKSTDIKSLNSILAISPYKPFLESGTLEGKLHWNGVLSSVIGNILLKNTVPTSKNILINSGQINFSPSEISFSSDDIDVAGTNIKLYFNTDKNSQKPRKINSAKIEAATLDLKSITTELQKNKTVSTKIPFSVENGTISANKITWDKISADKFTSQFQITPQGVFIFPKVSFKFAQGCVQGDFGYDPSKTELKSTLAISEMSAQALASTFNLPKKITGDLNAKINFFTKGKSAKELRQATRAKIDFSLTNGYSRDLRKIKYLLMAQNTVFSGVGNLNINKILNLFLPQNLGNFQISKGIICAKNGILTGNNIPLESDNLNLKINGNVNSANNQASLRIEGNLLEADRMGALGNLSINKAIKHIPAIGFVFDDPTLGGVLGEIPVLNGIGGEKSTHRYKDFLFKVCKNLQNKKTFKSFKWVDKLCEQKKYALSSKINTPW